MQAKFRDRIKEFRRVKASQLRPNEKNWRIHPQSQKDAMAAILSEIGFAGAEICRELPDGSLQLIDGHLRAELSGDEEIPVLVLDVDEKDAEKILLTFDPISSLATTGTEKLNALIESTEFSSASLRRMIDDLASSAPPEFEEIASNVKEPQYGDIDREKMDLQPEEHYDFVVICADNIGDWNRLVELLELPYVKLSRTHRRIGMGRAVRAEKLLKLIEDARLQNSDPVAGQAAKHGTHSGAIPRSNNNSK
jgi:hypothetical protein